MSQLSLPGLGFGHDKRRFLAHWQDCSVDGYVAKASSKLADAIFILGCRVFHPMHVLATHTETGGGFVHVFCVGDVRRRVCRGWKLCETKHIMNPLLCKR